MSEPWWEIAGVDDGEPEPEPGGPVAVWDARKVLAGVFGDNANAAYYACEAWAFDEDSLKTAVSAACEWGLRHDLAGKPGAYIRKSLSRELPRVTQLESFDIWERKRKGQRCPMCDGRGFDEAGPCDYCDGKGTLQQRRRVRVYKQDSLPTVEGGDGGRELDDLILTDPARGRFDPDYRRSYIRDTSPDMIAEDWPPPGVLQEVQWITAGVLARFMRERVEPAIRLGAEYVWVYRMGYREAAARVTAEGYPVSYGKLRRDLVALWDELQALAPAEPARPRLHTSREGFGGRIPIWQRNWFLDGLLL